MKLTGAPQPTDSALPFAVSISSPQGTKQAETRVVAHSRSRGITLTHIWLVLPTLVLLAAIWGWGQIAPNDFWWHIRTGQTIWETGQIPRTDTFTFTHRGDLWVNQSWLMQVGLYLIYSFGGPSFTLFVHAGLIVCGYLLLQLGLQQLTHVRLASALTLGAGVLGMKDWAVRPQGISFLLFGLTLFLIIRHRQRPGNGLWLWPLIFLVWVNAHGGFVFGLILAGSFVVSQMWDAYRQDQPWPFRQVIFPGVLSVAALALNPVGPIGIVQYVLGFVQHPGTRSLNVEFSPLSITDEMGGVFIAVLFFFVATLVRRQYRPDMFESIIFVIFGLLPFMATRNLPWFGSVGAAVAASMYAQTARREPVMAVGSRLANGVVLALLIGMTMICLPWYRSSFPAWDEHRGVIKKETPSAAAAYLCENLPTDARLFNEMSYGSYLEWECPQRPVAIDTRFELYSYEEWLEYVTISGGRYDWQQLLDRRGITHLLLDPSIQAPLVAAATDSPCWQAVYRDDVSVVFARQRDPRCFVNENQTPPAE